MFIGAGISAFLLRIWKIRQQDELLRQRAVQQPDDNAAPNGALPGTPSSSRGASNTGEGYMKCLRDSCMLRKV